MLQTLKTKAPLLLASHACPSFTAQTTIPTPATTTNDNNEAASQMPNPGPVSKTYHLPPRRQPKGYRNTRQNATSATTSPAPLKNKLESRNQDTSRIVHENNLAMPRQQKQQQAQKHQQSAIRTPTKQPSSRPTSSAGTNSHISAEIRSSVSICIPLETEPETEIEAHSPTLLQQRRDHWNGLHIGRDPYGLASKPYLDAGLRPPWPRCDWCEEEMVWLKRER